MDATAMALHAAPPHADEQHAALLPPPPRPTPTDNIYTAGPLVPVMMSGPMVPAGLPVESVRREEAVYSDRYGAWIMEPRSLDSSPPNTPLSFDALAAQENISAISRLTFKHAMVCGLLSPFQLFVLKSNKHGRREYYSLTEEGHIYDQFTWDYTNMGGDYCGSRIYTHMTTWFNKKLDTDTTRRLQSEEWMRSASRHNTTALIHFLFKRPVSPYDDYDDYTTAAAATGTPTATGERDDTFAQADIFWVSWTQIRQLAWEIIEASRHGQPVRDLHSWQIERIRSMEPVVNVGFVERLKDSHLEYFPYYETYQPDPVDRHICDMIVSKEKFRPGYTWTAEEVRMYTRGRTGGSPPVACIEGTAPASTATIATTQQSDDDGSDRQLVPIAASDQRKPRRGQRPQRGRRSGTGTGSSRRRRQRAIAPPPPAEIDDMASPDYMDFMDHQHYQTVSSSATAVASNMAYTTSYAPHLEDPQQPIIEQTYDMFTQSPTDIAYGVAQQAHGGCDQSFMSMLNAPMTMTTQQQQEVPRQFADGQAPHDQYHSIQQLQQFSQPTEEDIAWFANLSLEEKELLMTNFITAVDNLQQPTSYIPPQQPPPPPTFYTSAAPVSAPNDPHAVPQCPAVPLPTPPTLDPLPHTVQAPVILPPPQLPPQRPYYRHKTEIPQQPAHALATTATADHTTIRHTEPTRTVSLPDVRNMVSSHQQPAAAAATVVGGQRRVVKVDTRTASRPKIVPVRRMDRSDRMSTMTTRTTTVMKPAAAPPVTDDSGGSTESGSDTDEHSGSETQETTAVPNRPDGDHADTIETPGVATLDEARAKATDRTRKPRSIQLRRKATKDGSESFMVVSTAETTRTTTQSTVKYSRMVPLNYKNGGRGGTSKATTTTATAEAPTRHEKQTEASGMPRRITGKLIAHRVSTHHNQVNNMRLQLGADSVTLIETAANEVLQQTREMCHGEIDDECDTKFLVLSPESGGRGTRNARNDSGSGRAQPYKQQATAAGYHHHHVQHPTKRQKCSVAAESGDTERSMIVAKGRRYGEGVVGGMVALEKRPNLMHPTIVPARSRQ